MDYIYIFLLEKEMNEEMCMNELKMKINVLWINVDEVLWVILLREREYLNMCAEAEWSYRSAKTFIPRCR